MIKSVCSAICVLFLILSCKDQNEKTTIKSDKKEANPDVSYIGEWCYIQKREGQYIYCNDLSKLIVVSDNLVQDHNPMEDYAFKIDHAISKGKFIYLFENKEEKNHYKFEWIDKSKGIAKWTLNDFEGGYYVNKKNLSIIKKIDCEEKNPTCKLSYLSEKYIFEIEATEFSNEKEKTKPTAGFIIITKKDNTEKRQEIRFEPNSWIMYSDTPCSKFIVKDYNFDGLEDFAFVWDSSNSGDLYEYYFQDKSGNFNIDEGFPLQHGMLPTKIDLQNKILMVVHSLGCCKLSTNSYQPEFD